MSAEIKSLVLDTWAGRRYYAVELVGQTPKKARVRVLTPGGVMLPGRRYVNCGETVLVPKHAVVDLPKDTHKVEQGYYDGHLNGYGGVVDARDLPIAGASLILTDTPYAIGMADWDTKTDNDTRFGCLPYGFIQPRTNCTMRTATED